MKNPTSSLLRSIARYASTAAFVTLASCGGDAMPELFQAKGNASGLAGSGLVLQNNGREDLAVSADGSFAFAPALAGTPYQVTIKSQPGSPAQICTVSNGNGKLGADMAAIAVACVTPAKPVYVIGGTISGLTTAPVWLQNNAGDELPLAANGAFAFPTPLFDGSAYAVTVKTQPDVPLQTCTVTNGAGVVKGAGVTGVHIACVTQAAHTVGGTASGLLSPLVLSNGIDLPVSGDGRFTFPNTYLEGATYAVSIKTYPSAPAQNCSILNGSGTVGQGDVTDVNVRCDAPAPVPTHALGGSVSGLQGTGLVLKDSVSGRTMSVAANGSFSFGPRLAGGAAYALSVQAQPSGPAQSCTLSNGSGTIGTADVTNVAVTCPPPLHVAFVTSLARTEVFALDNTTGALTSTGSFVPQGGIMGAAVAANRFLYLPKITSNAVNAYTIDPVSGALAELAGSPFATGGSEPQAMAAAPNGKFLYVANRLSDTLTAFAVQADSGALTPIGLPVATGDFPLVVSVTPNGKFVYVGNLYGNSVSAFAIDAATGALTALGDIAMGARTRFMAIDANSRFLYLTTGLDNLVRAYAINGASGALTPVPGAPFTAGNTAQNLAIDGRGKFLYVSNEGDTTVSGFTIDAGSGALTSTGPALPTGGQYPEGVAVDPNGKFVYVADQAGKHVAVFSVDPVTGQLSPSTRSATSGFLPLGITVVNPQ